MSTQERFLALLFAVAQVLNEGLAVNFYEFVNEYRVREAQSRIADPRSADQTLLTIAFESGFNSKASFNRAFKRVTGQTPSAYARARESSNGSGAAQSIE
jgi:AraC-like DNA-binding protein